MSGSPIRSDAEQNRRAEAQVVEHRVEHAESQADDSGTKENCKTFKKITNCFVLILRLSAAVHSSVLQFHGKLNSKFATDTDPVVDANV